MPESIESYLAILRRSLSKRLGPAEVDDQISEVEQHLRSSADEQGGGTLAEHAATTAFGDPKSFAKGILASRTKGPAWPSIACAAAIPLLQLCVARFHSEYDPGIALAITTVFSLFFIYFSKKTGRIVASQIIIMAAIAVLLYPLCICQFFVRTAPLLPPGYMPSKNPGYLLLTEELNWILLMAGFVVSVWLLAAAFARKTSRKESAATVILAAPLLMPLVAGLMFVTLWPHLPRGYIARANAKVFIQEVKKLTVEREKSRSLVQAAEDVYGSGVRSESVLQKLRTAGGYLVPTGVDIDIADPRNFSYGVQTATIKTLYDASNFWSKRSGNALQVNSPFIFERNAQEASAALRQPVLVDYLPTLMLNAYWLSIYFAILMIVNYFAVRLMQSRMVPQKSTHLAT